MNPSNYMEYRDLQYERENIGYDEQYPEGGIKCKNYELCKAILPPDWWEIKATYLCMNCEIFAFNELEFRKSNEECVICFTTNYEQQVKFPTNCDHWFCVSCSRNILFWDETRYHLSPVLFGCPPCPNECINPEKGKQCYCEEYDKIRDAWEQEYPLEYTKYNDAEDLSINLSETIPGSIFSSKKCPLCNKKYERNI